MENVQVGNDEMQATINWFNSEALKYKNENLEKSMPQTSTYEQANGGQKETMTMNEATTIFKSIADMLSGMQKSMNDRLDSMEKSIKDITPPAAKEDVGPKSSPDDKPGVEKRGTETTPTNITKNKDEVKKSEDTSDILGASGLNSQIAELTNLIQSMKTEMDGLKKGFSAIEADLSQPVRRAIGNIATLQKSFGDVVSEKLEEKPYKTEEDARKDISQRLYKAWSDSNDEVEKAILGDEIIKAELGHQLSDYAMKILKKSK